MAHKINFAFSKKGLMKYISHLDLMRLLTRAMRRAELPLEFTQGFSPRPRLSLERALKLGLESENEKATVILRESISPQDFRSRLQRQLPQGIQIMSVN